jgi:lysozyme family protein
MQENFAVALKSILESEGWNDGKKGEMCDPADSGGFTVAGMTVKNFTDYFGLAAEANVHSPSEATKAQMRAMTEDHLGPYYKTFKWNVIRGDQLPPGVDLAVADVCTLHGPGKARQFLRRVLGMGDSMKAFEDAVIQAVWADNVNWDTVIEGIAQCRRDHYEGIIANKPANAKWRKGWLARTSRVTAQCCTMAPDRHGGGTGLLTDSGKAAESHEDHHIEA